MKKHNRMSWNPETGVATYTIIYDGQEFIGTAQCHPEDEDMKNEYAGYAIAEYRALIKLGKHIRTNELRPQLKILKHLYATMAQRKDFDKRQPDAKLVWRQIKMLENEIVEVSKSISELQLNLFDYIDYKEYFYKKLRKLRDSGENK